MIRGFLKLFSISYNSFEGQKSYEKGIAVLYRHWFVLTMKLLGYFLTLLLPFILWIVAEQYLVTLNLGMMYWFLVSIYLSIWWAGLFYALTMYFLDIWIVSDHRIIDNEQHGFFVRTASELHLSRIQDISVIINGPIRTFLDFGDLEVQTAGTEPKFIFKDVPHPNKVRDLITNAQNKYLAEHPNGVEVHENN